MNKLNYEILSAIDNIETTVMESEMNVMNSLISSYDKAIMILEYCDDDTNVDSFDIFQESVIMEADNNDGKKKNFIKNIIDKIKSVIKKLSSFVKSLYDKIKKIRAIKKDKYYYYPLGLIEVESNLSGLSVYLKTKSVTPKYINKLLEYDKYDEDEIKDILSHFTLDEIHDTKYLNALRDAVNMCINAIKHAEEPDDVKNNKTFVELARLKPINEILEKFDEYIGELCENIDVISKVIAKLDDIFNEEIHKYADKGVFDVNYEYGQNKAKLKYPEYEKIVKYLWGLSKKTSTVLVLVDNLLIEILNNPPSDDAVKKHVKSEIKNSF